MKSCFCFFMDGKQHKTRELDIITLRNNAPRSYMTWLPMPLSVLDMQILGPCTRSEWSKTVVLSEYKTWKSVFYCFSQHYLYIINKWRSLSRVLHCDKHDEHLRTRGKCTKQEPQASVFYISRFHLSQCNTRLKLFFK